MVSHSRNTSQDMDVCTQSTAVVDQPTSPTSADTQEEPKDHEMEWSDVSYEESESDEGKIEIIDGEMNADCVLSI